MSLRIGVLGASRIAKLAIVGPAQELGHRLVAVAAATRSERGPSPKSTVWKGF